MKVHIVKVNSNQKRKEVLDTMKAMMGKDGRSHFRLDLEQQTVCVDVKIRENEIIQGMIKDVSDGGIAFTLQETPLRDLTNQQVQVSFRMEDRVFQFDMLILRKFFTNGAYYYAGEFIVSSKIKQSQLSLLLMKMKLLTKQ